MVICGTSVFLFFRPFGVYLFGRPDSALFICNFAYTIFGQITYYFWSGIRAFTFQNTTNWNFLRSVKNFALIFSWKLLNKERIPSFEQLFVLLIQVVRFYNAQISNAIPLKLQNNQLTVTLFWPVKIGFVSKVASYGNNVSSVYI